MSERSVEHATIVIERTFDASPARVFAAWSDPEAKARWSGVPEDQLELDFRVGGREAHRGNDPDGNPYTFEARFQDIVPSQRIVYTYEMFTGETRISVSLATVELASDRDGTRLVFTEQVVFLDGHETPARREHGWGALLDALETDVSRGRASA
jgi:uncharacterized protein YndB with AHSA1/START domain